MITFSNISKKYITPHGSIPALVDINLSVPKGKIYGIIGKSGAGKSTLIRCANLLERPTSGNIIVDDEDLTTLPPTQLRQARRKIGMIFQHFNLLSSCNVYDNIALPLTLSKTTSTAIKKIIMPLLELVGLTDKEHNFPAQLSGGQKQRVAIARALASNPKVLLSDEATSALDPETTETILQLLKNIRDTFNVTILLITHEMSVIKTCCDFVGILHEGKLLEENDVGEFFAYPKTAVAKNFVTASFSTKLPLNITQHLQNVSNVDTHPIMRFYFMGDAATQPIISQLINQFRLRINILQGNIEYIKNHAVGTLVIALSGNANDLQNALNYLTSLNIHTEIIGHVPNNVIAFSE